MSPDPSQPQLSEEELEREYHKFIATCFRSYRKWQLAANHKRRLDYFKLARRQQKLLSDYPLSLVSIDTCIANNADFLETVMDETEGFLLNTNEQVISPASASYNAPVKSPYNHPTHEDIDKLCSVLRQLVREWSEDGEEERNQSFFPILQELQNKFPKQKRSNTKVLVPGAGLGRLPWEIAKLGFQSEGNEFSLQMVFTSNFIINCCRAPNEHEIHPWTHSLSNVKSLKDVTKQVSIPDISPEDLPSTGSFSMSAGDFVDSYKESIGQWDCVVTCFFIDTAKSVIDYIDTINNCLKPGGIWINLGPTLWHYERSKDNEISIELSLDDLKTLIRKMGWTIESEKEFETSYASMADSRLTTTYKSAFWVAKKPNQSKN